MKRITCLLVLTLVALGSVARAEPIGHTTVFARVPAPGSPEGIAVRNGTVYVGSHASVRGNSGEGPSQIFMYDLATGASQGSVSIGGQTLNGTHGLLAMAFDASGRLYVLDRNPARLLRLDLAAGTMSTYATIPDLPPCLPAYGPDPCSPTALSEPSFPDYLAFDRVGNAYVTDLQAATIFRVQPGGGTAEIWFQDARLDGVFGPNGIAVDPSGTKLTFAMTGSQQPTTAGQGIIYTLPLVDQPVASDLTAFFTYLEPAAGPDGIAYGASGKLYVALAGANQMSILNANGTEAARFPENPVANAQEEIPYDLPASIAFDGAGNLLVTNQSFFAGNSEHWAVLRAYVNDTALPLIEPSLP